MQLENVNVLVRGWICLWGRTNVQDWKGEFELDLRISSSHFTVAVSLTRTTARSLNSANERELCDWLFDL